MGGCERVCVRVFLERREGVGDIMFPIESRCHVS